MIGIDPTILYGAAGGAGVLLLLVIWLFVRAERSRAGLEARLAGFAEAQIAAQAQLGQRLMDQERAVGERLDAVGRRVGDSLQQQSTRTQETLTRLRERLAVMDEAQKNITDLSNQMVGLQDILSNKQARGAYGEFQLNDLVSSVLPPDAYRLQAQLSNGKRTRTACLLFAGPAGTDRGRCQVSAGILPAPGRRGEDDAARTAAQRDFGRDVLLHVKAIQEKYILPGETAEAALMFLPSEVVYAELHARHANVIEQSYRARVFIVSPTTLWATLNTVRAIFRDVRMRQQAGLIQKEVHALVQDVGRLEDRVDKLSTHFGQAVKDIDMIQTSSRKIANRGTRIHELELDDEPDALDATAGAATALTNGARAAR